MPVKEVALLGNPILRNSVDDEWLSRFGAAALEQTGADLRDTMRAAGGVGIAAPQIGVSGRVIALEIRPDNRYGATELMDLLLVRDPEIEVTGKETCETWEGCLSIPTLRGPVTRHQDVVLRGYEIGGSPIERELSGFAAVVAQHEVDHLDGVLFLDRMKNLELLSFEDEYLRRHRQDFRPDAS